MKHPIVLICCLFILAAASDTQMSVLEENLTNMPVNTGTPNLYPLAFEDVKYDVQILTLPFPGQPDLQIKNDGEVAFVGENFYNLTGEHQTKEQEVASGETAIYYVKVVNDVDYPRNMRDNITVRGPDEEPEWTVFYFDPQSGLDITVSIMTTGWSTGNLDKHDDRDIRVEVTPSASVPEETTFEILLTGQSNNQPSCKDAVKAITTVISGTGTGESVVDRASLLNLDVPSVITAGTTIMYGLSIDSYVSLVIYDVCGNTVKELVSENVPSGENSVIWNGCDTYDRPVPYGVYFCTLKIGTFIQSQKMVLTR